METKITFEMTDELFHRDRDRNRKRGRRRFLVWNLVIAALLLFATFAHALARGGGTAWIPFIVVVVVILLGCLLVWHFRCLIKKKIDEYLAKLPTRTQTYTIFDDHFLVEDDLGYTKFTWDKLERIDRFDDYWRLYFLSIYYLIPSEFLNDQLRLFLIEKANEAKVPIREFESPGLSGH